MPRILFNGELRGSLWQWCSAHVNVNITRLELNDFVVRSSVTVSPPAQVDRKLSLERVISSKSRNSSYVLLRHAFALALKKTAPVISTL